MLLQGCDRQTTLRSTRVRLKRRRVYLAPLMGKLEGHLAVDCGLLLAMVLVRALLQLAFADHGGEIEVDRVLLVFGRSIG